MSEKMKERTVLGDAVAMSADDGTEANTLTDTRADLDRLFAIASQSFKSMTENSEAFLLQSRQTNGQ